MKQISIVIGAGFGDEGKGSLTNFLASQNPTDSLVIRFSGGQQAGHTVIVDGIKHTFSNFGAASLLGVPTYFTEHTSIYLPTIRRELEILLEKGIHPMLMVNPRAALTTPYDVAYSRAREERKRHGSCGLGIGTTKQRQEETGYKLYVGELQYPEIVRTKFKQIDDYYSLKAHSNGILNEYNNHLEDLPDGTLDLSYGDLFSIDKYDILNNWDHLIFEGSQGIMLDRDYGVFPNVTRSKTTSQIPRKLIKDLGLKEEVQIFYVTRCYQTRHGNGWMSETPEIELVNTEEEINELGEWQGEFRYSELDYRLLAHAITMDTMDTDKRYPKCLAVTCLDQRPEFKMDYSLLSEHINGMCECRSPEFSKEQFKLLI